MPYSYDAYCAIYKELDGATTHYVPYIGTRAWSKDLLTEADFYSKLTRLRELTSPEAEEIEAFEGLAFEVLDLMSDLFLCEKLNPYYVHY